MSREKKSFDKEWELIHSSQEWGRYPAEPIIRFVARNYYKTERNKTKILDYGCGAGAHTWYLAREGFDTYGFDGSPSAIKRVNERFENEGLQANLKVADALDIDYADSFFDAVIDNVCIYANLIENIKLMYQDIYRILKPGGKLLTVCFGKRTDGFQTGEEIERDTFINITEGNLAGRGTTHFFDKDELEAVLLKAGFNNISIDTILYTDNQVQVEQYVATATK